MTTLNTPKKDDAAIRTAIEAIVADYVDGTYFNGLRDATFLYSSPINESSTSAPQELADRLVDFVGQQLDVCRSGAQAPQNSAVSTTASNMNTDVPICIRCHKPVEVHQQEYEVFEKMHWLCFHLEFEHDGDPDAPCADESCPWRHIRVYHDALEQLGIDPTAVLVQDRLH